MGCRNFFEGNAICVDTSLVSPSDNWMKSHERSRKSYRTESFRFSRLIRASHPFHREQIKSRMTDQ